MRIYTCTHCQSRNTRSGQCVNCLQSLGSPAKALVAAIIAGIVMAVLWIGLSWLTGMQLPFIAMVFGGLISLAVTSYSGGVGLLYQGIATIFTIASILIADTIVVLMLLDGTGTGGGLASLSLSLLEYQAQYDPYTFLFMVVGVIGGFYIWVDMAGS